MTVLFTWRPVRPVFSSVKQNLLVLLADMFYLFEINPAKCVRQPGMAKERAMDVSGGLGGRGERDWCTGEAMRDVGSSLGRREVVELGQGVDVTVEPGSLEGRG